MQLNKLVLDISPKTSWQCFDLGCRVAVANYKVLIGYWITLTLPIFALLIFMSIEWGLILFWLLKPWYERGLLYILSRTVFGGKVSVKQTLLALPSQIKPLWFSSVTYRRLAPSRSFDMAVTQLEKLSGERRSKRLRVLHKSADNNTTWWTLCCVHWESFLALALITLVQILLPGDLDLSLIVERLSIADTFGNYTVVACGYLSIALVAPFYVAGGFVAYLNRRVILEGWDIEIGFTKWRNNYLEKASKKGFSGQSNFNKEKNSRPATDLLSTDKVDDDPVQDIESKKAKGDQSKQRKLDTSSTNNHLIIAFLLLIGGQFLIGEPAYSQTISPADDKANPEQIAAQQTPDRETTLTIDKEDEITEDPFQAEKQKVTDNLEKILDEPPFAQRETVTRYRWKTSKDKTKESASDNAFLVFIAAFMAGSFAIVLWILFIAVFAYLFYRNWGNISAFFQAETSSVGSAPIPSFISTVFKEALPDDILLEVQGAIDQQNFRRALSILLRASFTYLSKEQHIRITKSMTEKECLREIKQSCPEQVFLYMQNLLNQWMKMAWAHQLPSAEILGVLLQGYNENFIKQNYAIAEEENIEPTDKGESAEIIQRKDSQP